MEGCILEWKVPTGCILGTYWVHDWAQTGCILRCTVHILIAYSGAYSGAGHILGTYTHVHTGCILTAYWTHTHVHTSSIQIEVKLLISQMMFLSSSCAVECAL